MKRRISMLGAIALLLLGCATTGQPTAPPTAARAPTATPEPSLDAATEGLGVITFGTSFDDETLLIAKPKTSFKRTVNKIAWSARFDEAAGASSVRVVFVRVSKGGAETILDSADVEIADPEFAIFANKLDLASIAEHKAGNYALRYLRDDHVLAEGSFKLTK